MPPPSCQGACHSCRMQLPILRTGVNACSLQRRLHHRRQRCLFNSSSSSSNSSSSRPHSCCRSSPDGDVQHDADESMSRTVSALEALLGIEEEKPKEQKSPPKQASWLCSALRPSTCTIFLMMGFSYKFVSVPFSCCSDTVGHTFSMMIWVRTFKQSVTFAH